MGVKREGKKAGLHIKDKFLDDVKGGQNGFLGYHQEGKRLRLRPAGDYRSMLPWYSNDITNVQKGLAVWKFRFVLQCIPFGNQPWLSKVNASGLTGGVDLLGSIGLKKRLEPDTVPQQVLVNIRVVRLLIGLLDVAVLFQTQLASPMGIIEELFNRFQNAFPVVRQKRKIKQLFVVLNPKPLLISYI